MIAEFCPLKIFANFYFSNSSSPILGEKHVINVKAPIFVVPEVMSGPCFLSVLFQKEVVIGAFDISICQKLHHSRVVALLPLFVPNGVTVEITTENNRL